MAPEQLVGANQYQCVKCAALVDADRSLSVPSPPQHLILSLKRFSYDLRTQIRSKLCTAVRVSPSVQLRCEEGQEGAENGTCGDVRPLLYRRAPRGQRRAGPLLLRRPSFQSLAGGRRQQRQRCRRGAFTALVLLPASCHRPWWCLNDDVVTSFEDVSAFEERDTPYILFNKRRAVRSGDGPGDAAHVPPHHARPAS